MKKIMFLLCVCNGLYAQTLFDSKSLKTYTVQETTFSSNFKSYQIIDQKDLSVKQLNVFKVSKDTYNISTFDVYKPKSKSTNLYDDLDFGFTKSKKDQKESSEWFENQLKKKE